MAGEKTSPANLQILNQGLGDRTFLGIHWSKSRSCKFIDNDNLFFTRVRGEGVAPLFTYQKHKFVISSKIIKLLIDEFLP